MIDLKRWQNVLETERQELESQLSKIGRINPQDESDWEVKPLTQPENFSREEVADELEEMDENEEIEQTLEQRLQQVRSALERIKNNKYGICEIGGEEIEEARLEANPAARTCKAHLHDETNLTS